MARKRKEDTTPTKQIEYQSFIDYLYTTRLSWVRHVIPVRYIDPNTGLYMEGYIISSIKPYESETPEEEDKDTPIDLHVATSLYIRSAFLTHKFYPVAEVDITKIFPSSRSLTMIDEVSRSQPGNITLQSIYPDCIKKFAPTKSFEFKKIAYLYEFYQDMRWTIGEIAAALNLSTQDILPYVGKNLIADKERICKMTGKKDITYNLVGIESEKSLKLHKFHQIATNLKDLYQNYKDCKGCSLGKDRIARNCQIVPPKGNTSNPIYYLLGEAPGIQEERDGLPFNTQAPAGNLLQLVLDTAGFDKSECFWSNAVICRPEVAGDPSRNGTPELQHVEACNARLKNEILLVKPKIFILLGKTAYIAFFGQEPESVISMTGWISDNVYFVPHPSYICRQIGNDLTSKLGSEYLAHFKTIKSKKL